ncbi:MAG: tetratricopeptide repeat protein [bacterium]
MYNKSLYKIITILFACFALTWIGCSKARKAGGEMDTPEAHYKQGMKYFNDNKIDRAEEEFNLAKSLDKKYPPCYAGLALTVASKARKMNDKKLAEQAEDNINKAKDLDSKNVNIWIAHGRVITIINAGREKPEKWSKAAVKQFDKALKMDPDNSEAYFRRGMCYRQAYMFNEAKNDFSKVLDLKGDFTAQADEQWKIMQDIERAARSENGKKIALVEELTRSDICVLFIDELNLTKYIEKRKPAEVDNAFMAPPSSDTKMKTDETVKIPDATDIADHWAKNFITDVMDLGLRGLDPGPNHKFEPDKLVNRGEFSLMLEDIVIAMTGDKSLKTKHIGGPERFKDIPPSHPYYNAFCNAVDRGYLKADVNGFIRPADSISGPQALLIMRELRNLDKNLD